MFEREPVRVLESMEDVRAHLTDRKGHCCGLSGLDQYRIKSVWLVSLIDEIVAAGKYPYNADIKKLAEQRLGLPARPDAEYSVENDSLSTLIYNAQKFRRSDALRAEGYTPFTRDVLTTAFSEGKSIEVFSEGLMGSSVRRLNVKKIGEDLYAMVPKKRKYHVAPAGQPVRVVA